MNKKFKVCILLVSITSIIITISLYNYFYSHIKIYNLDDIKSNKKQIVEIIEKKMKKSINDLYISPSGTIGISLLPDGTLDNAIQFTVYYIDKNKKVERTVVINKNTIQFSMRNSQEVSASWINSIDYKERINADQYVSVLSTIPLKDIINNYVIDDAELFYLDFNPLSTITNDTILYINNNSKITKLEDIDSITSDKILAFLKLTPYKNSVNENNNNVINLIVDISNSINH